MTEPPAPVPTSPGDAGVGNAFSHGDFPVALPGTTVPPPAPTWREFFISQGIPHKTEREIEWICDQHCIRPEDFDKPVSKRYWAEHFDCVGSPSAQAFWLLRKLDLGPELGSARGPLLEFHEGDNHPGSNDRWVNAKDKLSLSLLQARLIDLKLPIKIAPGT